MNETLLVEPTIMASPSIIKVIGVGGGGGNAVAQMYREGIDGVNFLVCNTDRKALETNIVPEKMQMGPGLGAGGSPEHGRRLAEEAVSQIDAALDEHVKMVFITAGMGGGTGTGASPVIARRARIRGILTVGVVTLPFLFERERVIDKALDGLETLAKEVDAILVINNQRLFEIYPNLTVIDGFKKADQTLTTAVRSIVEIITMRGRVGLDFRDVNNVLRNGGVAIMSTGYGRGEGRVTRAIEDALYSPLLNQNDVYRARRLILSITTSSRPDQMLRMEEMAEVNQFTARMTTEVDTKWGLTVDDSVGDAVRITILASGYTLYKQSAAAATSAASTTPEPHVPANQPADSADITDDERRERRFFSYPELDRQGTHKARTRRTRLFLYDLDHMDDEALVEAVEAVPTARRTSRQLAHLAAMQGATQATTQPATQPSTQPGNDSTPQADGSEEIDFTAGNLSQL